VPLAPDTDLDSLLIKEEYVEFLERTHLDEIRPQQHIEFTVPGRYQELEAHIAAHHHLMSQEQGKEVLDEEAIADWYDHLYIPLVEAICKVDVLEKFPGRTEADLYVWILRFRGELEERYGREVSPDEAVDDLTRRFDERVV